MVTDEMSAHFVYSKSSFLRIPEIKIFFFREFLRSFFDLASERVAFCEKQKFRSFFENLLLILAISS